MHAPPNVFDPLRGGDPDRVGGYRLRARLGSGGMGEVFLSFAESGQPVAVKVVRREFADNPQFRARFAREVRAARRVGGPYIAPLLEADPDAAQPWLATVYVAGPTLADAVQLYGPLPVASVIVLMSAIAESLGAIHGAGIVHRDLKPANVVLGPDGLRVIDFGIARAADASTLTLSGMIVGSPQYVAPEQVLGEPPAPAGDVFALGALAHYAATGRAAFGEGPEVSVVYRVVHAPPDLAGCPLQVRALITSCLAKDPADRPTTAEIVDACRPDEQPRRAEDWLPAPVAFAIESYGAALADLAAQPAKASEDGPGPSKPPDTVQSEPPGPRGSRPRRAAVGLAAALLLAGAGTGVALGITSIGSPSGTGGEPQIAPQQANTQAAHPPPAGPPSPPPPPTSIVWSGTVRFTDTGVWLDGEPPRPAEGGVHGDVRESAPAPAAEISSNSPAVANLALWNGPGTPTGSQCQDLAFAHGVWQLHVSVGDVVCALTAGRRVAVLKIEALPSDFSGVTAYGTLWGGGNPG